VLWWTVRGEKTNLPEQENPTELKSALIFAALFAGVLVAVAAAKTHFGNMGLYPVAILSGLTDMDAITLSSAEMARESHEPRIDVKTAARLILMASLANIVFKAGMIAVLGSRALFLRVAIFFGIALVGGGLLLWLM
jgi:uncharacterized membrane protein (DUF4010 family)